MNPRNCLICGQTTKYICGNIFQLKTSCSTPIKAIIQRIYENSEQILEISQEDFSCQECLLKINEYDEAYMKAKQVETHLLHLLDKKAKIQNLDENDTNIIFHCKRGRPPRASRHSQSKELCLLNPIPSDAQLNNNLEEVISLPEDQRDELKSVLSEDIEEIPRSPISSKDEDSNPLEDQKDVCIQDPTQWNECQTCGKVFGSKTKLGLHQQTHKTRLKCDTCNKNFKNDILLEIHRQTHEGKSELECVECCRVFSSKGALIKHLRIHRGEYIYQCEQCGKQFIHDSSMRMHKLVHEDSREKKCSVCNRGFRSTQHLKRHFRTHTGEKPYYCKKCGKRFAQKYNMMSHYSKVHSISVQKRLFPCSYCAESFPHRFQVSEHIRHNHSSQEDDTPLPADGENYNKSDDVEEEYAEYLDQPDEEVIYVG